MELLFFLISINPRTNNWFLIDSLLPSALIMISYLIFIHVGSKVMKHRSPLQLRWLLVPYNFALVLMSAYLCIQIFSAAYEARYSVVCQAVESSEHPWVMKMAKLIWLFYISKIVELLDTVFFILRKKFNQVSFLHCYHHCTIVFNTWMGVKYAPGGQNFLIGLLNSFVHVVMYAYYGLSALGPHMQKYLWWKRHLTQLQLVQFFALLAHMMSALVYNCGYPLWFATIQLLYIISLIILFINFYIKSYQKKQVKMNGKDEDILKKD
ncbi:very long chain fatty acid elongase 4-like isoform X2 [Tachypleus tridentatus]|uniref:very long chain fatty acid elongase 4-like isoform X2 n=1 Tax=Tachypleus tridentatus TaxID=6853 RepID=UPI003FD3FAFA